MICTKMVVAYDGSELGKKALSKAIDIAGTDPNIEIEVVHVVNYSGLMSAGYPEISYVELKDTIQKHGKEIVEEANDLMRAVPNKWRATLLEGQPADKILEHAEQNHCDLIIMGSRGLGALKKLFLGSVSHNVTQYSPIPVYIVKDE